MNLLLSLDSQVIHPLLRGLGTPGEVRPELIGFLDFFISYSLFCFTFESFLLSFIPLFEFSLFSVPERGAGNSARAWVTYLLCPTQCVFFFLDFHDSTLFCLVALLDWRMRSPRLNLMTVIPYYYFFLLFFIYQLAFTASISV